MSIEAIVKTVKTRYLLWRISTPKLMADLLSEHDDIFRGRVGIILKEAQGEGNVRPNILLIQTAKIKKEDLEQELERRKHSLFPSRRPL